MSQYFCGVDIGGTFTDCVVIDRDGRLVTCKSPSTPKNFSEGMLEALGLAAAELGISREELCRGISVLSHGTTTGTNAIIQKRGAKVGLITTKGHNDVIHIMRGSRGLSGTDIRLVVHIPESQKPDPIVPKRLIRGVSERVDCFGKVVVELNEDELREATRELVAAGVEAIAVCFLWSFLHPDHERRAKEIIAEEAPGLFVTCSHELVPKWGEYERTTAVALNAYIGPVTSEYLGRVDRETTAMGYEAPLQITQCAGGTISVHSAMEAPLLTLDSGPVSGVMGSQYLGELIGTPNVITTDMGGTSFDVGIIYEGTPASSYRSLVNQYEYYLPKVDIQTVGSGGGSIVWIDEVTGTLRVGPESAGADPGPVCYGRGGTRATVTDADVVLGYLDAENFAGGRMPLDRTGAERAVRAIAEQLGIDLYACASGIAQIAEFQMADLIRKTTIQKGFDPRDFVIFAFGGAGPVHAGVFARELGIERVIVPQRETASVWCAFGAAASDMLHVDEKVEIMTTPFDPERIRRNLAELRERGAAQLERDGVPAARQAFAFSLDMRHKGQINEVEIALESDRLEGVDVEGLREAFRRRYELLYGTGAALPGAKLEIVTFRCRATAPMPKPTLPRQALGEASPPAAARRPAREIYWAERKSTQQ
ncbi:MAG: hydantoinase/oxoprolinase family protein, partial [Myxococcales bacterium]|nr:hydantoinase/oxoprolinase family protein [Myxococcales bacterium]